MTIVASDRLALLAELPLFRWFSPEDLADVDLLFEDASLRKGQVLWHAGDDADALVVVASGELEVIGRLAHTARDEWVRRGTTAIAVISDHRVKGRTLVAGTLTALLHRFSGREAVLVRVGAFTNEPSLVECGERAADDLVAGARGDGLLTSIPVRLDGAPDRDVPSCLDALVTKLRSRFPYQVFDLGATHGATADAVVEVCDVVVHVGTAPVRLDAGHAAHTQCFSVVNLHDPRAVPLPVSATEPFVLPRDEELAGKDLAAQVRHIVEQRRTAVAPPLHRLARKVLGACTGVALGGGAALALPAIRAALAERIGVPETGERGHG